MPAGIDERDAAFVSDGCGYRTNCFGQVIDIDVPFLFSQADPMVFTFTFDASSVPPGIKLGKVSMVHNGVLLKRCTGPGRDARAVLRVERRPARRRRLADHRPYGNQRQLARGH